MSHNWEHALISCLPSAREPRSVPDAPVATARRSGHAAAIFLPASQARRPAPRMGWRSRLRLAAAPVPLDVKPARGDNLRGTRQRNEGGKHGRGIRRAVQPDGQAGAGDRGVQGDRAGDLQGAGRCRRRRGGGGARPARAGGGQGRRSRRWAGAASCSRPTWRRSTGPRGAAKAALDAWGGIDILVNNAGMPFVEPILETTPEHWDMAQAVNLRAPFLMAQALAPGMIERRAGQDRQHQLADQLDRHPRPRRLRRVQERPERADQVHDRSSGRRSTCRATRSARP